MSHRNYFGVSSLLAVRGRKFIVGKEEEKGLALGHWDIKRALQRSSRLTKIL